MIRYLPIAYFVTVVLAALTAIVAYINLAGINHLLVIRFDSFWGINYLGQKSDVWGILGVAAALSLINVWLSRVFYHRLLFFGHLFAWFNVLLWVLMFVAVSVILSVN